MEEIFAQENFAKFNFAVLGINREIQFRETFEISSTNRKKVLD